MSENLESREVRPTGYQTLEDMLDQINGDNGEACRAIYAEYKELFQTAPGSSHNHQAWPGGYQDHVTEAMNLASALYDTLDAARDLPFDKSDALLVMFLHDLEKPFKYIINERGDLIDSSLIRNKKDRAVIRQQVMDLYGIELSVQQANAMRYVEGIRDEDYTPDKRIMGELAALCHCADVLSARLWYNHPLAEGHDSWQPAARVNPKAAGFILASETTEV